MRTPVPCLHPLQSSKFRENQRQQPAAVEVDKPFGWNRRKNNLIQFIRNALTGNNPNPFLIAAKRIESIVVNIKAQLRGKTDTAHHAQRVVTKSNIGVERSTNRLLLHIFQPAERIYQFTETCLIETNCKGVDSEIPTVLVIFQRTVLYNRFARIPLVRFSACTYKFDFRTFIFYLCRSEILENRNVRPPSQMPAERFRHCNSTAYNYYIYIFRGTLQKNIANITAYHIALQTERIRRFGYLSEDGFAELLLQFLLSQLYHSF